MAELRMQLSDGGSWPGMKDETAGQSMNVDLGRIDRDGKCINGQGTMGPQRPECRPGTHRLHRQALMINDLPSANSPSVNHGDTSELMDACTCEQLIVHDVSTLEQ
jgi:hypothetical protein